jgi:ElaB/YqjD/DUF883 family membrane-anchored ribosome-binding protein
MDMAETQVAKDKLIEDFNAVVADSEALLKTIAATGGEKAAALRTDLERRLADARVRLAELEKSARERARAVARDTDEYVRDNPWRAVAIGAGLAAIVGIVLGLLLNRR